ncbi:MAG: LysR family transcriptional regulator [Parashewanella sp.]
MDKITAAKVFKTIVENGSMAAASKALDMSRSMISRYLNQMEEWAGTRLLHRSTRSLSLTPAGETVLQQSSQLLNIAADISAAGLLDKQIPAGHLRISCAHVIAQSVLTPFLKNFLMKYPKISIEFNVGNHVINMVEERIDLAIRITNDLDPNIIARPLATCRSVLCASPEYLEKYGSPTAPVLLEQHNCLTYSYFRGLWSFGNGEESIAVPVNGNFSANESGVLLNAVLSGMGVSLLPLCSVLNHIESGQLIQLLPEWQPDTLGVYGIYRTRKHHSLALQVLMDSLIEYFAEVDM